MRILMIGGTGLISSAVTERLIACGHEVVLLTRGRRPAAAAAGAAVLTGDIDDAETIDGLIGQRRWDVVVDWIVYKPDQARRDLRLFAGRTDQYVFISSASAYRKPVRHYLIDEDTPLENPYWEYSRDKIACEEVLREAAAASGFPLTIVRPSLTYGDAMIPFAMNSWDKPWTLAARLLRGEPVVVPGDGTSLWTVTHNSDFARGLAGLLGNPRAIGEAFHIASDEVLNWNLILEAIAEALGVEAKAVHVASDFIAAFAPELDGGLRGDKADSAVFDLSKLRRFVPDFRAAVPFREGIGRTVAHFRAHPELCAVDAAFDELCGRVIRAHDYGKNLAAQEF
jgi:nucleoside-diphosphate-sugar epimerase